MVLEKLRIRRDEVRKATRKQESSADSFYATGAKDLVKRNQIPEELYIENKVKRGLRNANGTGVVVGLTHIGEVIGYTKDEKGNKVPQEGRLYYRGYDVEDLVNNAILEDRFGFEEISYLLMMGELPTRKQLDAFF